MPTIATPRELITDYARLRRLEGITAQARGRRFNQLIGDTFASYGIDCRVEVRGVGEADVLCKLGDTRFVIEAKWESQKTDTGSIAKLQKRIRQRPTGTLGLMVSMASYSDEAVDDHGRGDRVDVLLLDASHFEAMLSGVVPVAEIIERLRDHVHATGQPYASLPDLLAPTRRRVELNYGSGEVTVDAETGARLSLVVSNVESDQLGIAARAGRLLITTSQGVGVLDADSGVIRGGCPVVDCCGSALPSEDGVIFARRQGLARWDGRKITVLAGGYSGATTVLMLNGTPAVFDNGGTAQPILSTVGNALGEQVDSELDLPRAGLGRRASCQVTSC